MNKTVLILSGPTHEYIDPVRFIGNASSGLMGKALAEEALKRNFLVQFITGPVAAANLPNLGASGNIHPVTGAEEMLLQAENLFPDAMFTVFAAAVADYTPVEKLSEKMAKSDNDLTLRLRATPDIAKTICRHKHPDQITLGFALQTSNGKLNARRKLVEKNLDGIVLNTPASLGADDGTFSFISSSSDQFADWGSISKPDCARRIFHELELLSHEK